VSEEETRLEVRYDVNVKVEDKDPVEPHTALTLKEVKTAATRLKESPEPFHETIGKKNESYSKAGARPPMTLKTINDYEFDTKLITRFNLHDYRRTKQCRESIRAVTSVLLGGDCNLLAFGWVTKFKLSIF